MNYCCRCQSMYRSPGTCNCFAPQGQRLGPVEVPVIVRPSPAPEQTYFDKCPCNPKNGGNGICGCVMGSRTITYSATHATTGIASNATTLKQLEAFGAQFSFTEGQSQ